MFVSETVARAIHADRVRDLERAARERRMLEPDDDVPLSSGRATRIEPTDAATRRPCGESARLAL